MKVRYLAEILITAGCTGAPGAWAAAPNGYRVAQSVTLSGCACKAEMLEDARLTDAMRNVLAGVGVIDPKDEVLFKTFAAAPMKNAAIRIVGPKGKVTDRREFDVPLAILRDKPLALGVPKASVYSLEVDRNRGEVAFSGPAYYFFSVQGGRFDWVKYADQATGKRLELVPTINARNEFSLVPRADRKGKDFLLLRCDSTLINPQSGPGTSTTFYTRVHYEGGGWHGKNYTKAGDNCRGDK